MSSYTPDLPHFGSINQIPIADVAAKVGLEIEVSGKQVKIVCPRWSKHDSGKSKYLTVLLTRNRVVCDGCDTYPLSVLDMVQEFCGFNTPLEAAECIAAYFPELPRKAKASFLHNPAGEQVPEGCRDPWILLVKSGIWAQLTVPSQRLSPVLLALSTEDEERVRRVRLSNRAMFQYSGMGSFNSLSESLTELAAIGFLERPLVARRKNSPERETAAYIVTPFSSRLWEFAKRESQRIGEKIFNEKQIRSKQRQMRERKRMFGL